jgi:hypothetical protein
MPSSTSSFDLSAVAKAAGAAVVTIAVAWAAVPKELPYDEQHVRGAETLNELIVERFSYEHPAKPVVLLGSSILTDIPPVHCRPDNVASIYLQGRSALTGLEVIRRVNARPEVVFVEVTTAMIGVDEKLLEAVFSPFSRHIQELVPALRRNRNWVILFYRRKIHRWSRPRYLIERPAQSIEQWNESRAPHIAPLLGGHDDNGNIDRIIPEIVARVRELERSGTRVIFHDPADPRLRALPRARNLRDKLKAALPGVLMIEAPDAEQPLYRWDGLHFSDASGLWLFNYLMKRAGIAVTAKCRLGP